LTPGSILLVHTTASPDGLRRIASRMPEGVALLDACFSGGPTDAAAGRLTLMVGGTADALERARAPLKCYSAHIDHVGEVGDGQLVKLLNNLLFATNVMNSVELLRLAEAQGLPPARAAAVIQRSSGASYAMELFARGGAPDDMMPAIRPYLEKDVASAVTAAKRAGIAIDAFAPTARFFEGPAVQERAPPGNPSANRTTRPSDR
jgi:3-hydroxyisobutyrate dehydrogenase-like beta-hydroxyacid dehydrogenase